VDVSALDAIDVHTQVHRSVAAVTPEEAQALEAMAAYFKTEADAYTVDELARYYRDRNMAAVTFTVDVKDKVLFGKGFPDARPRAMARRPRAHRHPGRDQARPLPAQRGAPARPRARRKRKAAIVPSDMSGCPRFVLRQEQRAQVGEVGRQDRAGRDGHRVGHAAGEHDPAPLDGQAAPAQIVGGQG